MQCSAAASSLSRHGHTPANGSPAGMRMSGWTDTPLSDDGRLEASLVAEALRRHRPLSALYTSPLRRARDTAEAILVAPRTVSRTPGGCVELPRDAQDRFRMSGVPPWPPLGGRDPLEGENRDVGVAREREDARRERHRP
jgi:bisphosphoglycerate-dependent phosphoglycerate mutase